MRQVSRTRALNAGIGLTAIAAAAGLAACGSSSSEPTKLAVTVSDAGKGQYKMDAPKQVDGGLVEMTLTNKSKAPHSAQLALIAKGHTFQQALKTAESNSQKTPSWIQLEGGAGTVAPGKSATVTVDLPAGDYGIVDFGSGAAGGKPPFLSGSRAELTVASGESADLPSTDATISANQAGKDRYKWDISGLKAGENTVTFNSKGQDALHHIVAAPITGNASIGDVKKALESNSGPPPLDINGVQETAILDGGSSETTQLDLKPGRYAFICFLNDRDGGKPHFEEGLLKQVQIKGG